ncbi:hypothetical protein RHRU231_800029 [Rhodococcus ruber]|uniref:Uncharacterized protein n=1 Tax=Rhodococcus ruber TaxID=1830 RepID=A0A098BS77_9NOCA|nr:hypothetical protein RHRU231_800029 [Rhodococcus ruber]
MPDEGSGGDVAAVEEVPLIVAAADPPVEPGPGAAELGAQEFAVPVEMRDRATTVATVVAIVVVVVVRGRGRRPGAAEDGQGDQRGGDDQLAALRHSDLLGSVEGMHTILRPPRPVS